MLTDAQLQEKSEVLMQIMYSFKIEGHIVIK